jgi:hypothetical protein
VSFASVLDGLIAVAAVTHAAAVLALIASGPRHGGRRGRRRQPVREPVERLLVLLGPLVALVIALATGMNPDASVGAAALCELVVVASMVALPTMRSSGAAVWSSFVLVVLASVLWGGRFVLGLQVSSPTLFCLLGSGGLALLGLPSSFVQTLEGWEVVLRSRWLRPTAPVPDWSPEHQWPRVSVHVPVHAEPPELVMDTLDHLARLRYPNFEVLVIDNNTSDPQLWKPVARHCKRLGESFRFYHVEGLTGAKAGALNWALPLTDESAELIAVVDADYQVDADWLKDTVGHFEDPKVAFVQCPHAYRDYGAVRFGRMINAEYTVFFATGMVAMNEHDAGITVGTMSLIRRQVLEEVGRLAEWCLTEDSELAIRVHAAGYSSVYLPRAYGWGVVPATFESYRRQRFRWTYGPVQELLAHWSLLTRATDSSRALRLRQRVHHVNHGLDVAMAPVRVGAVLLMALALVSMLVHGEHVAMPFALWLDATSVLFASVAIRWLVCTRGAGQTLAQAIGGTLAFLALTHVISVASSAALCRRPASWHRTEKRSEAELTKSPLTPVRAEIALAVVCLSLATTALVVDHRGGIAPALAIGVAYHGLAYLLAVVLSIMAARHLRQRPRSVGEDARRQDDLAWRQPPADSRSRASGSAAHVPGRSWTTRLVLPSSTNELSSRAATISLRFALNSPSRAVLSMLPVTTARSRRGRARRR